MISPVRALLWTALLLAPAQPVRAHTTLISRAQDVAGVHIAYLVEAPVAVSIMVTGGDVRVSADETEGYRATVTGTLDACRGALVVDGQEIIRQRCVWLPRVGKG